VGVTTKNSRCSHLRLADYGDFHAASYGNESEAVLFFPFSGEVVIASIEAITAFEASDTDRPEYQELCKTLGILGVRVG
jgi:hypothetical protein